MFGNGNSDRLQQAFADQFSADGNGFIYRRYEKGVPIRVSKSERDRFVAAFNKRIRYIMWSILPLTVVLILLAVWLFPDFERAGADLGIWIGVGAVGLPFLGLVLWAWNSPKRELERRTPEGPALSKIEARALALSKITYGQLTLAALMGVVLVWERSGKTDIFRGLGMVWLVFGGALVLLAGVQAIRKWRMGQH